jgi:hypothetical protein
MIKSKYFGNVEFNTSKDLMKALKKHSEEIISFKKSIVHKSIDKGQGITYFDLNKKNDTHKLPNAKDNHVYPIINSTMWMDSHDDVHLTGCYSKTVDEQQGKVYLVDAHGSKASDIISYKSDVAMFVDNVDWLTLGKNLAGKTECLIFDIARENIKESILKLLDKESDIECSFRMKYYDIFFACDSDDKSMIQEKEMYEKYRPLIGNKDYVEEMGYFFGVKQLGIIGEGSICPITGGSNSATTVYQNSIEPLKNTHNPEPLKNTLTDEIKLFT